MFIPLNGENNQVEYDFIFVSGDAYVDHPSFANALICRVLEHYGYSVAMIAQPNVDNYNDFRVYGKPKYAFLVSSGNIESMVNHYSVNKKRREVDEYTPQGLKNQRPDRCVNVYCNILKAVYPDSDIVIGGIEASLRRFAHYDYWDDTILPSILLSSQADLLVYGMGEKSIIEIASYYEAGLKASDMTFINGTAFKTSNIDLLINYELLPSFKSITSSKQLFMESFLIQKSMCDSLNAKVLIEKYDECYVVQNVASPIVSTIEFDDLYALNFMRMPHPLYKTKIPAFEEVEFSINVNRGCNGSCSFCAITYHQGRSVSMRSVQSCVQEALVMKSSPNFKGYINDVGGPTANFNDEMCDKLVKFGSCKNKECMGFKTCNNLKYSHDKYLHILEELRNIEGIKKVFVRSGIRYDYALNDYKFIKTIAKYHVSGQLRLAPEHTSDNVLRLMNKPSFSVYEAFVTKFNKESEKLGLKQYVLPYLISSHPGSTIDDAFSLALYLKSINFQPEQVQDFYPTPATLATAMYYCETDASGNKIYVAKTSEQKRLQRALLQFNKPANKAYITEMFTKMNRKNDLKRLYNLK